MKASKQNANAFRKSKYYRYVFYIIMAFATYWYYLFASNWLAISRGQYETSSLQNAINDNLTKFTSRRIQNTTLSKVLGCKCNQPYPRPKHACTTNVGFGISYCHMESLAIMVDNIEVSKGNENVEDVLGRTDEAEIPNYTPGAYIVERSFAMTGDFIRERPRTFYLKDVLDATQTQAMDSNCTDSIDGPVLLITRYEYCNLFHTMTDWFNTFYALSNPNDRPSIVFLDGHAKGSLDPIWQQVFGKTYFIKSYPKDTRLCLNDATFVPAGYVSPLWTRGRQFPVPPCTEMMDAFVERFLTAYDVLDTQTIPGCVTIIGRKPYLAHPRSKPGKAARTISNLHELADRINGSRVVYFEAMTFKEQLKIIRETQVLIANHGAALTHLVFLNDGATAIEFAGEGTSMFEELAAWRPLVNRVVMPSLAGSSTIDPYTIRKTVDKVNEIL